MSTLNLRPADLRCTVDAQSLGFGLTSELVHLPLPWIGQERAEVAARFGLTMDQAGYNLFVLGEVGSGRSSLIGQMMLEEAAKRAVPPDLCYLHNFDAPERPRALRLPAGEGRLLRQLMGQFAKRLQSQIPKRFTEADFKAESERASNAHKAEEERAYLELSAFAGARNFLLLREQGNMVFTFRDTQGEPLTAGKAMALSREEREKIDAAEEALRMEISRYLEKSRSMERALNERLAALRQR